MRICLMLAAVLALGSAASAAERDQPTAILVSPIHEAQVVRGDDGMDHVEYELLVISVFPEPVTLTSVTVLDPTGKKLMRIEGGALTAATQTLFAHTESAVIPASAAASVDVDLILPPNTVPERVTHKIAYILKADSELAPMITSLEIDAPEVTINRQPAIVTKPPVRGEGWLASTACCKPNLHRDLHIAIDGVRIETAETFDTNANTAAIDLRPDPYAAEDKLFRRDGHAASRADQADRTDPNAAAARIAGSKKRQDAGPLAYRSRAREPLRRRLSSARLNFSVMLRLAATVLGRCEAAWRGGLWARG